MGLLEGLKNRVAAKLSITQGGREAAEQKVDQARTQRQSEALDKTYNEQRRVIARRDSGQISDELAKKQLERRAEKFEKERQLPGDRVVKGATTVGSTLKKGVSRIADDLAKPKKKPGTLKEERTTTDKSGKTTTIRTYRAPPKQLQPRGRPRSYRANRGGFTPPAASSGGGGRSGGRSVMPRMPPMNFDMGFGPAPKKKRTDGKKSPMDPFNFDIDF